MDDRRNLFTAIALSLLVLLAWNFFVLPRFATPKPPQIEASDSGKPASPGAPGSPTPTAPASPGVPASPTAPGATAPATELSREEALKASPRIPIGNAHLSGSIALKGARIDDLTLTSYRETTNPASPNIVLLSPSHTSGAFYADFGLLPGGTQAGGTQAGDTPKADTLWQASGTELTPKSPLTLSWTNPQGVEFKREIAVDDDYMFTVTDTVANHAAQPFSVFPYAAVVREGTPQVAGYYVLFEG